MSDSIESGSGQPALVTPRREQGAEAFTVSPFNRLARTHALSVAGDTLLTIALADSLFFDVDPNDARWKVGLYLLLTIAPFAVIAPFLGPVMDRIRGGHRYMIIGTALIRAMVMAALVVYVQDWPLFPLAFAMLVMGKTYAVAKSAVVPTTVATEDALVRSNSRLAILSAVSGASAGVPGVLLLRLGGAPWVLGTGVVVFLAAAVLAFRIPATRVAAHRAEPAERAELKGAGILVASSAMGYLRGAVGFITMLLAFDLRGGIDLGPTSAGVEIGHRVRESLGLERLDLTSGGAPPWHFGVALIGVGLGGLIGSATVPRLRATLKEERILAYALIALTAMAVLAGVSTGLGGAFVMSFAIALSAQGGKQAFDAIVQRDAPMANLGRTFSRYESRFQLIWVLGALLPVVIPLPARVGYFLVAGTAAFVAATYWFGRTPNPAAIVSDGILDEGLDRLAGALPGPLGDRLAERNRSRAGADDPGPIEPADDTTAVMADRTARMPRRAPKPDRAAKRSGRTAKPDRTAKSDGTAKRSGRTAKASARAAKPTSGPTGRSGRRRSIAGRRATADRTAAMPDRTAAMQDRTAEMRDSTAEPVDPTTDLADRSAPMAVDPDETQIFPGTPDPPARSSRRRPPEGSSDDQIERPGIRRPPAEPDSWPSRRP